MDFKPEPSRLGNLVETPFLGRIIKALIPPPLPPVPPVRIQGFYGLLEKANQNLGRLDGITSILPEPYFFIYMYTRKEALLSSQIEGTQSSFFDLLLFESREMSDKDSSPDVVEVSNYVKAMNHGLEQIRDKASPISLALVCDIHKILLSGVRGGEKKPGEFRDRQNWIGGPHPQTAVFVPPPPEYVHKLMSDLESFILTDTPDIPTVIKAGLIHLQFETVHPFLDGNGRLGRLLITLFLCAKGVLSEPLLYLSLYFKTHRYLYYNLLQHVRETGDWESWLEFFLDAVVYTSVQASETAHKILDLSKRDHHRIEKLGRQSASLFQVYSLLQRMPVMSVPDASKSLELSQPTIRKALRNLQKLGILKEVSGKSRGQIFVYKDYLDILSEGTEPIEHQSI
ncbi:MAG: Fic family protein [Candidatus Dadabacteria bacterium]|nr:Fic family protein [Candidatus Dadabacteria bacterium]